MIQVKIIEEDHEQDCTDSANRFLAKIKESDILHVHYSSSHFQSEEDQIFSFSVCIVYRIEDNKEG